MFNKSYLSTFFLSLITLVGVCSNSLAEPIPDVDVCQEMANAGSNLLSGDPTGFFFIDGLGGEFPAPSFLKVTKPLGNDSEIFLEMIGKLDGPELRQNLNVCDWHMSVAFGSADQLTSLVGNVDEWIQNSMQKYTEGETSVWVTKPRGLRSYSVIAANSDGYASFTVNDPNTALWLINFSKNTTKTILNRVQEA